MSNFFKDFFSLESDNEVSGTSTESRTTKVAPINSKTKLDPLVAQGLSPIDKLNDDCLRLVFQHLPIFDKVRIESGKIFKNYLTIIQKFKNKKNSSPIL